MIPSPEKKGRMEKRWSRKVDKGEVQERFNVRRGGV